MQFVIDVLNYILLRALPLLHSYDLSIAPKLIPFNGNISTVRGDWLLFYHLPFWQQMAPLNITITISDPTSKNDNSFIVTYVD
jgi:hypothetical protein